MDRQQLGRVGEDAAVHAIKRLGWSVLTRNWRCVHGEIDIVAVDGDEAVVIEVKTRRSRTFGTPAEAVTHAKQARLRRLAAAWLANQERRFTGVRVDVIAVEVDAGGDTRLEHLKGVT